MLLIRDGKARTRGLGTVALLLLDMLKPLLLFLNDMQLLVQFCEILVIANICQYLSTLL